MQPARSSELSPSPSSSSPSFPILALGLKSMSVHLPPRDALVDAVPESGSESSASDDDQAFSDWASDGGAGEPCTSLFEPKTLPSAREARAWDTAQHGFDLDAIARRLSACGLRSAGEG
jgi:hypothetical protein